jgi:predicted RNase H-like HicB family nuclease
MTYRYLVVLEKEGRSYGASVPDLPGCVAVARTLPAAKKLIRDGIALHVEDLIARGDKVPKPGASMDYIEAKIA